MKFLRKTGRYTLLDYKKTEEIMEQLKAELDDEKLR
jgi:hypothetical protein